MTRLLLLALALMLQACAPSSPPGYLAGAANPAVKVRPLAVTDAAAGTRSYAPAEPGDWDKINRAVTPTRGQK